MDEKLYNVLMKLPKKNIINLMWEALDAMQAYNGRTRTYCLLETLGAKCINFEDPAPKYKLPSVADMRRNTESMGL